MERLRVLVVATNVWGAIGGGQTCYQKIMESCTDVEFSTFVEGNSAVDYTPIPQNITLYELEERFSLRIEEQVLLPEYCVNTLEEADRFARCVRNMTFDIVEFPDYTTTGAYLAAALKKHNVKYKLMVAALHGNISTSLNYGWEAKGLPIDINMLETKQIENTDVAYGISARYLEENKQKRGLKDAILIDPRDFIGEEFRHTSEATVSSKPNLYCIGRSERIKGNDIFVEVLKWLDKDSYSEAYHIGNQVSINESGEMSGDRLRMYAMSRDLDIGYLESYKKCDLADLYRDNSVLIITSRYDTLNLVALEALFSGCVTAISSECGVCDYIDSEYPGMPYVKIDFNEFHASIGSVRSLIENYSAYKENLNRYLDGLGKEQPRKTKISSLYTDLIGFSGKKNHATSYIVRYRVSRYARAKTYIRKRVSIKPLLFRTGILAKVKVLVKRIRFVVESQTTMRMRNSRVLEFGHVYREIRCASRVTREAIKGYTGMPEKTLKDIDAKRRVLLQWQDHRVNRCRLWLELSRLERMKGNSLKAVAYELRIMRLLGRDVYDIEKEARSTLMEHGFHKEAKLTASLYGKGDRKTIDEASKIYYKDLKELSAEDFEAWQDWRRDSIPSISVIVSLYNAENKLKEFLDALSLQDLAEGREYEVILVDSGSPSDEQTLIRSLQGDLGMNLLYARTTRRETIQAAWNKGIRLSRGKFLVFLGVDETLYPEALEVMARELESDVGLDWVMGDSLVTEVDTRGVLERDIMRYRRDEPLKELTRMETCYLSYVGGMYKKEIHNRVGMYDESYTGAGDTEFKNRALGQIRVKHIKELLGEFLNYADGQTTASPKAEIEDLTAWYEQRTQHGVTRDLADAGFTEMVTLLKLSLGYRKSYCSHTSTDYEYGLHVGRLMLESHSDVDWLEPLVMQLSGLVECMRELEFVNKPLTKSRRLVIMANIFKYLVGIDKCCIRQFGQVNSERFNLFRDNRYEQHSWIW